MEGHSSLRMLRELLEETSSGTFMNDRTSYDYLYMAVTDFILKTHYLTSTQSISIVAGTTDYNLNPDFIQISLTDDYNRPVIKHTYGGSDTFIYNRDYASVVIENSSETANVANAYSITDASQPSNIAGTATSTAAATNGECTLTDTAADFTNVAAGDFIHNTTDGSHGVVVSKTSTTELVVALFEGTANDWTSGDAYVVVLQPRYKLVISPAPAATATATVVYIKRPDPVYSSYRAYKLPFNYVLPIIQFAAFLYKYRDKEPNYGDKFYQYYDGFTRKVAAEMRRAIPEKQGMRCNFRKINARSKSFGGRSY